MEKENLQDISLQSLQWLESRGLFGGGGGNMHHMGSTKGLNINSNSGNGSNVVTSESASGNHQRLGMQYLNYPNKGANRRQFIYFVRCSMSLMSSLNNILFHL